MVTDRYQDLLSTTGRFYLVAVKENDISAIRTKMLHIHQLQSQVGRSLLLICAMR